MKSLLPSTLLAAAVTATGMLGPRILERRFAGGRALSVRANIARRALMALAFRQLSKE